MSSPLSTAMFIVYNIESIPSNVSRVVSTKYLHCGEKNALHCKNVYVCSPCRVKAKFMECGIV